MSYPVAQLNSTTKMFMGVAAATVPIVELNQLMPNFLVGHIGIMNGRLADRRESVDPMRQF